MVLESGVHHSLHQNCHHQIIFAKFNLEVCYPLPYERTISHYSQANVDHIQQAVINIFDWENAFLNTDVDAFLIYLNRFDRVWHEGLLFKLRQNGISGKLITLKKDFLSCRK